MFGSGHEILNIEGNTGRERSKKIWIDRISNNREIAGWRKIVDKRIKPIGQG